jgi:hypothetical protein
MTAASPIKIPGPCRLSPVCPFNSFSFGPNWVTTHIDTTMWKDTGCGWDQPHFHISNPVTPTLQGSTNSWRNMTNLMVTAWRQLRKKSRHRPARIAGNRRADSRPSCSQWLLDVLLQCCWCYPAAAAGLDSCFATIQYNFFLVVYHAIFFQRRSI